VTVLHLAVVVGDKAQIPLRRLPRNFPVRASFGDVGVMGFGLNTTADTVNDAKQAELRAGTDVMICIPTWRRTIHY